MGDLEQLHGVMLNMLKDIDAVCRQNGICYYLGFGTLLGAVRHHGFIPWDDDADIMMPRKDYERFLTIADEELGSRYFVQNHKSEPFYRHPFTKIRRNGTACVIQNHRHIKMHQGIFIDVFPLENAPAGKLMRSVMWKTAILTDRLCAMSIANLPRKYHWLAPAKRIIAVCFRPSTLSRLGNALTRLLQPKKSDSLMCVYVPMGRPETDEFPSEWLGSGKDTAFEGLVLRIPQNAEACLRKRYGDFMRLPPVEQRQPVHARDGTQISATQDYRLFIPELYGKKT